MKPTQPKRNSSLDGIRTLAITLIVASHTGLLGQGGLGNAIFFCLSGFLASIPFKQDVEKTFLSAKEILLYYVNRIIRIIPVYYVVIISVYVITQRFFTGEKNLLANMLFINNFSHLWFLQQEMLMYVCMPFIFIFIFAMKKILNFKYKDIACAIILVILAFTAQKYLTADIFYLNGNGGHQAFRIGQFLIGIAAGYLYKSYRLSNLDISQNKLVKVICESIVVLFLLFSVLSSSQILGKFNPEYQEFYIGWRLPMFCTIITGILIIALLINASGWTSRFLGNRLFAYIGEISFGIYLIHMFLVPFANFGSSIRNFLGVYLVSICIAAVLHVIVEKPSMMFAKTRNITDVIEYYKNL